ncbi:hypothetical protein F4802DRAFT_619456 [Xylaria palmicola]|nr:hypothetical protein F4802DRAFT_619456 [Xylaria palmicola]
MSSSSTTGLSRARSIRRPPTSSNDSAQSQHAPGRDAAGTTSPSRLPMRPPTTTTTTAAVPPAAAATATSRRRAPSGLTSRQVSISSSTRASSRIAESGANATATAKPLGRAQSVRQAPSTTTTTPSPSTISRSASTVRPRSSTGLRSAAAAPRERAKGHVRAKSTVTSLTTATTLRPLSHVPSRSNPSPAPSTASSSTATTTTQTAPTSSSSRAQTRSQTKHARVPSSSSQSRPRSTSTTTTTTAAPSVAPPPALAARRPAFDMNQQHYSPAKSLAPKPLTSTFLAPPSPSKRPANVALTAETSRLQAELLQLSLLRRAAPGAEAAWHASARARLGARFRAAAGADRALRAAEREAAEARGLRDLVCWGSGSGDAASSEGRGLSLDEKIQRLDQVLGGVWALGEPAGRYQRAARAFEDWACRVAEIRAAQRGGDIDGLLARGGGGDDDKGDEEEVCVFVSDLDASAWKRDHAGLVRILEGWRRTLAQLGAVDEDEDEDGTAGGGTRDGEEEAAGGASGLARTLRACRGLVHGMLAELALMERTELDALAAEEAWMEMMEARLLAEAEGQGQDQGDPRRPRTEDVPPWKLLVS